MHRVPFGCVGGDRPDPVHPVEPPEGGAAPYGDGDNFNVMALTDAAGVVKERYEYDPYGACTVTLDDSSGNPFLFQGQRYCPETGLYYFKNRDYSPTLGRFLQRDPIGYNDGMNLHEALGSSPGINADPEGKDFGISAFVGLVLLVGAALLGGCGGGGGAPPQPVVGVAGAPTAITITIEHDFDTFKVTPEVINEVNRIMGDCVKRCAKTDKNNNPLYAVNIAWTNVKLLQPDQLDPKSTPPNKPRDLGWVKNKDGSISGVNVYVHDRYSGPRYGAAYRNGWNAGISTNVLTDPRGNDNYGWAVGGSIVHEAIFHVIGNVSHGFFKSWPPAGFIDSPTAIFGSTLSNEGCQAICKELGIQK